MKVFTCQEQPKGSFYFIQLAVPDLKWPVWPLQEIGCSLLNKDMKCLFPLFLEHPVWVQIESKGPQR